MAYLFGDSFDLYATVADTVSRWATPIAYGTILPASNTAFGQGQCLSVTLPNGPNSSTATVPFGSNETTIYGSIRLKWSVLTTGTLNVNLGFQDNGATQCMISWTGDGSI